MDNECVNSEPVCKLVWSCAKECKFVPMNACESNWVHAKAFRQASLALFGSPWSCARIPPDCSVPRHALQEKGLKKQMIPLSEKRNKELFSFRLDTINCSSTVGSVPAFGFYVGLLVIASKKMNRTVGLGALEDMTESCGLPREKNTIVPSCLARLALPPCCALPDPRM